MNEINSFEIRFEFRAIKKNQARISTFLGALPILISRTGDDGRHLVPHGETYCAVTGAFRLFSIYRRKMRHQITAAFRSFVVYPRKVRHQITAAFRPFAIYRRKREPRFTAAFCPFVIYPRKG